LFLSIKNDAFQQLGLSEVHLYILETSTLDASEWSASIQITLPRVENPRQTWDKKLRRPKIYMQTVKRN